jgi:hypothetical protein
MARTHRGVCQTGRQPCRSRLIRNDIAEPVLYGAIGGKNGMAMRFGLAPSRNFAQVSCPILQGSSERRIILSRWTCQPLPQLFEWAKKSYHVWFTATRRTAGSSNDAGTLAGEAAKDA